MKTLKIIYYRIKFKEALTYAEYWKDKANGSFKSMKQWATYVDHTFYWMFKALEYCIAMDKESES